MVEIEKLVFNISEICLDMKLVIFSKDDIDIVRDFVLKQYANLERKDFFIIDDLDTELPDIFEEGKGKIYGILYDGKLIAIQAVDYSDKNDKMLRPYVQCFLEKECRICELGWALVDWKFRGYHIADYLLKYIEKGVCDSDNVLVATVHPENVNALGLYFKNGFSGFSVGKYYGYCRMFLLNIFASCDSNSKVYIECTNLNKIKEVFKKGYLCLGAVKQDDKKFLSLYKKLT